MWEDSFIKSQSNKFEVITLRDTTNSLKSILWVTSTI